MNIADLKKLIADSPDDMEVMVELHLMPEDDIIHHPVEGGEVDTLDDGTFFFLMASVDPSEIDDEDEEEETVMEH